jgi:hypothetical protein
VHFKQILALRKQPTCGGHCECTGKHGTSAVLLCLSSSFFAGKDVLHYGWEGLRSYIYITSCFKNNVISKNDMPNIDKCAKYVFEIDETRLILQRAKYLYEY